MAFASATEKENRGLKSCTSRITCLHQSLHAFQPLEHKPAFSDVCVICQLNLLLWFLQLSLSSELVSRGSVQNNISCPTKRRRQWHPTPVLLPGDSHGQRSLVGCSPWGSKESDTTEPVYFHTLEKEMATHSSVLAWSIPGTGEPDGLLSMGSHRVGHYRSNLAAAAYSLLLN